MVRMEPQGLRVPQEQQGLKVLQVRQEQTVRMEPQGLRVPQALKVLLVRRQSQMVIFLAHRRLLGLMWVCLPKLVSTPIIDNILLRKP